MKKNLLRNAMTALILLITSNSYAGTFYYTEADEICAVGVEGKVKLEDFAKKVTLLANDSFTVSSKVISIGKGSCNSKEGEIYTLQTRVGVLAGNLRRAD